MPGTLSIVATPIGNLKDITLRALDILTSCDLVACEDTRVTSRLLAAHGISKPLFSLHEHSDPGKIANLIARMRKGAHVAYATDAGTPGMNDPGGKLVAAAFDAGIRVEPIPGPSALTAAISVCGFPMDEFAYLGFVPHKKGRETFFRRVAELATPCVFLESTHRIGKTLDALESCLDLRRTLFVGRELSKLHETLYRGPIKVVNTHLRETSLKGEFIVIVGPKPKG